MQPPLAVRVQEVSQFRISHIYTLSNKNLLEGLVCVCVYIYTYMQAYFLLALDGLQSSLILEPATG